MKEVRKFLLNDLGFDKNEDEITKKEWDRISIHPFLTEEYVFLFKNKLNCSLVLDYHNFSEDFLRKLIDDSFCDWLSLSSSQKLSESFIRDFEDKVDWKHISYCQMLSEDFIREFKDRVNWHNISCSQALSESFIREFKNEISWEKVTDYKALSEDFIREFQEFVDFYSLYNNNLSEGFIREFQDRLNWIDITENQNLSDDFIIEFKNKVDWYRLFSYRKASFPIIKQFILKSKFRNIDDFKSSHLTVLQRQEIQKILDLKYMFNK
jgi:hypothetical protein